MDMIRNHGSSLELIADDLEGGIGKTLLLSNIIPPERNLTNDHRRSSRMFSERNDGRGSSIACSLKDHILPRTSHSSFPLRIKSKVGRLEHTRSTCL